jgi:hypothetical protein
MLLLQVYAASIMFGYFLRRVDKRFQLESALGMIDSQKDTEEAAARLERLFAQVCCWRLQYSCTGACVYRYTDVLLRKLDAATARGKTSSCWGLTSGCHPAVLI